MVFDFSLSSPSTSYQLPGTVEPWFQVSILTATILMNRFHHLIPGFFSPIEVCFLSSPFNPPTVWFSTVLASCQNQVSQPSIILAYLMFLKISQARSLQTFSILPPIKTTWSSLKSWNLISFTKSFLFPSIHSSSLHSSSIYNQ